METNTTLPVIDIYTDRSGATDGVVDFSQLAGMSDAEILADLDIPESYGRQSRNLYCVSTDWRSRSVSVLKAKGARGDLLLRVRFDS